VIDRREIACEQGRARGCEVVDEGREGREAVSLLLYTSHLSTHHHRPFLRCDLSETIGFGRRLNQYGHPLQVPVPRIRSTRIDLDASHPGQLRIRLEFRRLGVEIDHELDLGFRFDPGRTG
jgi:hypothetical protein